jgi:hypothetical protein
MNEGSYMVGLDLGQATDYSALAVVERVLVLPAGISATHYHRRTGTVVEPKLRTELRVRHLQRWDLGTPYPAIVADAARLMRSDQLRRAWLSYDATGVGRAVKDLFWEAFQAGDMGDQPPPAVTITGAEYVNEDSVPKRNLIAAVQVPLQQGLLKITRCMPLADVLERELTGFRMKLTASGRDTYDIGRRAGAGHGDLVIALALAARRANHSVPPPIEEAAVDPG